MIASDYCSSSVNKFEIIENLERWIESECENKSVLLCGDFDIDFLTNNNISREMKNVSYNNGLKQVINEPTRKINGSSIMIELATYVNLEDKNSEWTKLGEKKGIIKLGEKNYGKKIRNDEIEKKH